MDEEEYLRFLQTLPGNLRDTKNYDMKYLWKQQRPKDFIDGVNKKLFNLHGDGSYHGNSVEPKSMRFLKKADHPTVGMEVDWYNSNDPEAIKFKSENYLDTESNPDYYQYKPRINESIMKTKKYNLGTKGVSKYPDGVFKKAVDYQELPVQGNYSIPEDKPITSKVRDEKGSPIVITMSNNRNVPSSYMTETIYPNRILPNNVKGNHYSLRKYNLGVQKVDVSPGSQGNEKFLYGNQYGQMGAGLGGTVGSGIGMAVGGPMGAQVGKLAGTALGYGAGYLIGNQKGKDIAKEMDTQRGNELNINRSIDYQNDNFSGKDMYQDKKMFENTGYLDNKQLYAKYGLKNAPKEKIEVEKDEMIFRKNPKNGRTMLVADFKGGDRHEEGGEDFLAQDGDIIYPGKMRDQIKSLVGQDGYVTDEKAFEMYRQQLPEDTQSQTMAMGTAGYLGLANDIMNTGSQLMNFNKNIKAMDKQMLSGQGMQMPQQQNKAMGSILGAGQSLLGMLGNKQGSAVPVPEFKYGVREFDGGTPWFNKASNINYSQNKQIYNNKNVYNQNKSGLNFQDKVNKAEVTKANTQKYNIGQIKERTYTGTASKESFDTGKNMQKLKESEALKRFLNSQKKAEIISKGLKFLGKTATGLNLAAQVLSPYDLGSGSDMSNIEEKRAAWKRLEDEKKGITPANRLIENGASFIKELQSLDSESQKEIIDTFSQSGNKELADTLKQYLVTPTTNKQNVSSSKPNSLAFSGTNTTKNNTQQTVQNTPLKTSESNLTPDQQEKLSVEYWIGTDYTIDILNDKLNSDRNNHYTPAQKDQIRKAFKTATTPQKMTWKKENSNPSSYSNIFDTEPDQIQYFQPKQVERFTMDKDGNYFDSQYNKNENPEQKAERTKAFQEYLATQKKDFKEVQYNYYKKNVAKPELPTQSGEDMNRDDIAFQMENIPPFSAAQDENIVPYTPEYAKVKDLNSDEVNNRFKQLEYTSRDKRKFNDGTPGVQINSKLNLNNTTDFFGNREYYNPNIIPMIPHTVMGRQGNIPGQGWSQIDTQYGLDKGTTKAFNSGNPNEDTQNSMRGNPYQLEEKKKWGNDILHPGEVVNVPYNSYRGLNNPLFRRSNSSNGELIDLEGGGGSGGLIPPQTTTQTPENVGVGGTGGILTTGTGNPLESGTGNPFAFNKAEGYREGLAKGPMSNGNLNPIINAASKVASNTTDGTLADSKSSFLNMIPNIIGTGANMLYAHGLTKERSEKRDATRVQLEKMKYQDRSNPQRYLNLLGSKLAMKNATNYAGGSINNLLGASAMSNAAYQQQANQIEQGESGVAIGLDQQNVGIGNQQNILNAQYFDQNKTANEMNDAKTRDIIRQGRLGMATTANQSIQNFQTMQKDNILQAEQKRRYGLSEKLFNNQIDSTNKQTEAQDYSTYASLISYRDKYAENDPRRAEIEMLLKRFQKKYNFTNL